MGKRSEYAESVEIISSFPTTGPVVVATVRSPALRSVEQIADDSCRDCVEFASLSGVPRADTIDSHKMRSVSHRTLELFDDDPTVVDLTQDDPLFIPTTLLSSIPLDRNASSSSSIGSQGRRTSSATARQSIASHGGALETDVRPIIKVQTEYSTVARSLEKDKKHHLTCMVTIEMPSRYPSAIISRRISPIITQDPKRNRPSTAESRSSGFYPRPSSPSGSTFSSYTYGSTTGHESIPPLPSNPFASVVEDLHRRMQDWKGHSPEFGALRIFDRLSIRKGDREHEFLIYARLHSLHFCALYSSAGV